MIITLQVLHYKFYTTIFKVNDNYTTSFTLQVLKLIIITLQVLR